MTTPRPFSNPNYYKNVKLTDRASGNPCVLCGKNVKNPAGFLTVADGGAHFVMPGYDGSNDPAYMGCFPIGKDCYRQHPELKPYLITQ